MDPKNFSRENPTHLGGTSPYTLYTEVPPPPPPPALLVSAYFETCIPKLIHVTIYNISVQMRLVKKKKQEEEKQEEIYLTFWQLSMHPVLRDKYRVHVVEVGLPTIPCIKPTGRDIASLHLYKEMTILNDLSVPIKHEIYRQLRARRALILFKCVPLRTRWALYKIYGDSAFLVLTGISLNSSNAHLILRQQYVLTNANNYYLYSHINVSIGQLQGNKSTRTRRNYDSSSILMTFLLLTKYKIHV